MSRSWLLFFLSLAACAADAPSPPGGPTCGDGCVLGATEVGSFTVADLQPYLAPGAVIDNGYTLITIDYRTSGRTARATVAIPFGVAAPAGGFHVVANAHGTTGVADACAVTGTVAGSGLAGTFGAYGMIGVAPDYPGLGTAGPHPYLVSESEGKAVLDALRAATAVAAARGVRVSGRSAVGGMSQGGHASLAAAALHATYAPELDVRAFAAAAPASVWEEHWRAGALVDGPHLVYHALLVHAWREHYQMGGRSPFATPRIDELLEGGCIDTLPAALGTSFAAVFDAEFLAAYRDGTWGEWSAFGAAFAQNRVRAWAAQTAPVKIYQGDADATVLETTTSQLVDALRAGGLTIDYDVVPGAGHVDVAFGYVCCPQLRSAEARQWLRAQLDR